MPSDDQPPDFLGLHNSSDAESSDEEESKIQRLTQHRSKRRRVNAAKPGHTSDDEKNDTEGSLTQSESEGEDEDSRLSNSHELPIASSKPPDTQQSDLLMTDASKLKPLSKEELAASKAATAKTGVVYLSRIPPYMKPMKVKDLLSRFGKIGRVFLAPEDPKAYACRVRFGGNKKRNFEEGWVEFLNKKEAKLAAETLNTNIIGGKKNNFYHDDVWNIKYLPKFKWHHLQHQIALENASRQAKMRAEIAHETRVNKQYLRNVERAKMVENMQAKKQELARKRKHDGANEGTASIAPEQPKIEIRRQFRQHKVKGRTRPGADAEGESKENSEKVKRLLSTVF